jgi:hypothetical protein
LSALSARERKLKAKPRIRREVTNALSIEQEMSALCQKQTFPKLVDCGSATTCLMFSLMVEFNAEPTFSWPSRWALKQ